MNKWTAVLTVMLIVTGVVETAQASRIRYDFVWGRSATVERVPTGTLIVEISDAKTGKLVWHGMGTDALASSADQAEEKTSKAVAKLLKKFPSRGAL